MKKLVSLLLVLTLMLAVGCAHAEDATSTETAIRIGALKGPTAMGMAQLLEASAAGENAYQFTIAGAADELTALLVKGELDVAAVPANLASVLYNNTQGGVRVAMINTLGVLYVLEAGETVQSVADLKGREIYSTGKGTTPEYALDYVLTQNGIDPDNDVTVEFKSESTELAAALENGEATLAVLPEPYVTTVLSSNENVRVALSLNDEWDKVSDGSGMVTGVLAVAAHVVPAVRALLRPVMVCVKSVPVASFVILALVWVRSQYLSVFISFLMALPIFYSQVGLGLSSVDMKLLEMADVFNVGLGRRLRRLYLPAVGMPLSSACRLACGLCWKAGVAAEVIGLPPDSIGERLYDAKLYLNTGEVLAWTVVIVLISLVCERLIPGGDVR